MNWGSPVFFSRTFPIIRSSTVSMAPTRDGVEGSSASSNPHSSPSRLAEGEDERRVRTRKRPMALGEKVSTVAGMRARRAQSFQPITALSSSFSRCSSTDWAISGQGHCVAPGLARRPRRAWSWRCPSPHASPVPTCRTASALRSGLRARRSRSQSADASAQRHVHSSSRFIMGKLLPRIALILRVSWMPKPTLARQTRFAGESSILMSSLEKLCNQPMWLAIQLREGIHWLVEVNTLRFLGISFHGPNVGIALVSSSSARF